MRQRVFSRKTSTEIDINTINILGFALLGAALAFGLFFTPDNGKNRGMRLSMLLGFAFFSGLGMGPLLDLAIRINPTIVPNALLLSSMIFASFTGVSLFAPDGQYLFLGGTLLSGLSTLFWLGLINLFFQSQLLFQVYFNLTVILSILSESIKSLNLNHSMTRTVIQISFSDIHLGRTLGFLWFYCMGYSNDHRKETQRRWRLYWTLT